MTKEALNHIASSPNVQTPNGGMSHDKMLSFVASQTKHGLQHLDSGGVATTQGGITGVLSGALGTNNNFQGQSANITAGTNAGQLNTAYTGAQNALGAQQNLVNQTSAGTTQGLNNQSTLANQYAQEAAGQGPNPAQAALNQTTGQNISQQAALAAGQRGAGANAGLEAAQNAQQGAATQQQAVGQGATLQAQQQLAAQNAGANLAATQVGQGATAVQNQNQQQQNEQNILQGANTSANNANVAMQSNINNVNAGVSEDNQQAGNSLFSGVTGALGTAAAKIPGVSGVIGSVLNGLGSVFAHGGIVKMDKGGNVLDANARAHIAPENFALPGGRYPIHDIAHARNALARVSQNGTPEEKTKVKAAVKKKYPSIGNVKKMDDGGTVSSDSSNSSNNDQGSNNQQQTGGEMLGNTGTQEAREAVAHGVLGYSNGGLLDFLVKGGNVENHYHTYFKGNNKLMDNGGKVAADNFKEKAKISGDSLKNDKVPAMLSEGEIVIPRHITMGANAPARAAQFVANELKKRGRK